MKKNEAEKLKTKQERARNEAIKLQIEAFEDRKQQKTSCLLVRHRKCQKKA